jgi:hypothetical protein
MCRYWKKNHTCTHLSDRTYLDMCRSGRRASTICPDISDDTEMRPSHFPCWPCIKSEVRADSEALARANQADVETREAAAKAKQAAEARLREERLRREYREKAAREREEEARRKEEREREMEKAKMEGGLWIETGSGRRGRHRRGPLTPVTPLVPTPTIKSILTRDKKENVSIGGGPKASLAKLSPADTGLPKTSPPKTNMSKTNLPKTSLPKTNPPKTNPPKDKPLESSGRAGVWGPKKTDSNAPKRDHTGSGLRN